MVRRQLAGVLPFTLTCTPAGELREVSGHSRTREAKEPLQLSSGGEREERAGIEGQVSQGRLSRVEHLLRSNKVLHTKTYTVSVRIVMQIWV